MTTDASGPCNPGAADVKAHCGCPWRHPWLGAVLLPVWRLLPGRVQARVAGDPCWARSEYLGGDR
jgi:hypothetical protein